MLEPRWRDTQPFIKPVYCSAKMKPWTVVVINNSLLLHWVAGKIKPYSQVGVIIISNRNHDYRFGRNHGVISNHTFSHYNNHNRNYSHQL